MKPYIHAVLLLHHANKPINEENLRNTIVGVGLTPDPDLLKVALESVAGVNLVEVLARAEDPVVVAPVVVETPTVVAPEPEKPKPEPDVATGLEALFGD